MDNKIASIKVFVPVGTVPTRSSPNAAPRSRSEFVIGLLDNHKHNTDKILDHLQSRLSTQFTDVRFVRMRKPEAGKPAPAKVLDELASCAAVITGIGD